MDIKSIKGVVAEILQDLELANTRKGHGKMLAEMAKKDLLDTNDLMILFNVGERTIQRWRKKRLIRYISHCGRYYYLWDDVLPLIISGYD